MSGGGTRPEQAREGRIRVPRTARYRVLGDPGAADEVWFVLHGYGQLAERFIDRFAALPGLRDGVRAVVAPEALSRFYVEAGGGEHGPASRVGATWMTREDREHEIRDYVEYLDRLAAEVLEPERRTVRVLGFSQGAATASRWVAYGRVRPAELILWAGGLAHDLEEAPAVEALRRPRIRFVTGSEDRWARERERAGVAWLEARGLSAEVTSYAGGHTVVPGVLETGWPV